MDGFKNGLRERETNRGSDGKLKRRRTEEGGMKGRRGGEERANEGRRKIKNMRNTSE